MKFQFEVWHQRGGDLVATYFTCEKFIMHFSDHAEPHLRVDVLGSDDTVSESYWFSQVYEYHWGPADE